MKWDFAIGNPAYQDQTLGDNKGFAPPIYDKFIDAACEIADKVEMIHPARFLFNAGATPKAWNEKMLNDPHFKVLFHEADVRKVFPNTNINGGIVISYYDRTASFGEIGVFTQFSELNQIRKKVSADCTFESMGEITFSAYSYHFSKHLYDEFPKLKNRLSKGHDFDLKTNVFELMPEIFSEKKWKVKKFQFWGERTIPEQ